ncbi:MAG TPA: OmpW family outer membrane protein [Limnobacter sp.]|nr:OmpW family outer membrane protein [Limnobacter sp.]
MGIKSLNLTLLGVLGCAAFGAQAAVDEPWLLRLRAVHMDMANQSDPIPALGVTASDTVHVSNKTIPEIDISYFFTPNWAAELVLTYPQRHNVTLVNNGTQTSLGSFKHLPPVLSLQYHFKPGAVFQPYAGVGVNYTKISSVRLAAGAQPLDLESNSIGLSLNAGMDYRLSGNMYLNVDVKKIRLRSDVLANGASVSKVKLDPLLIGVGVGWRF